MGDWEFSVDEEKISHRKGWWTGDVEMEISGKYLANRQSTAVSDDTV